VVSEDGDRRNDEADDGDVGSAEVARVLPVNEDDARVVGALLAVSRATTVGVAVDRVAVDRSAVDGDVRDDLVRVVVVGDVERDDCVGRLDNSV
jgi:hypothetical protein